MITLFSPSYQSIVFTLHELKIGEFEVVTYNPSIKEFCNKAGIKVLFREGESDLSLKGLRKYRDFCKKMVGEFAGKEILFCFYTFDIWSLYQLIIARKKCRIFFYNTDDLASGGWKEEDAIEYPVVRNIFIHYKNNEYRKKLYRALIIFFITGKLFDIFYYGKENYALGLNKKTCRKLFRPYKPKLNPETYKLNQQIISQKYNLPDIDILLIDGGLPAIKYPETLLNFLLNFAEERKINLVVKPHPTFPPSFNMAPFKVFEKNFPVELLGDLPRLVITSSSGALLNISKNTPAISIFYLLEFEKTDYTNVIEKFLNGIKILLPRSIDELNKILTFYFDENKKI